MSGAAAKTVREEDTPRMRFYFLLPRYKSLQDRRLGGLAKGETVKKEPEPKTKED